MTFDNEHQHECRLDLGCGGNDQGFAEHCLSMARYYRQHKGDVDKPWLYDKHHQQLVELINTYEFDHSFVDLGRMQVKQVEEQAKAEEAAKEEAKEQASVKAYRESVSRDLRSPTMGNMTLKAVSRMQESFTPKR